MDMLAAKNYLWNSGIFLFSVNAILAAYEKFAPAMLSAVTASVAGARPDLSFLRLEPEAWGGAESIPIDYAIMERSYQVFVLPASFDWNDLGTWGSLYEKMDKDPAGNALARGSVLTEDCRDNMIRLPEGKIGVLEGLEGFIVVDTEEVLLVVPKAREQEIKQWVARVKDTYGPQYT